MYNGFENLRKVTSDILKKNNDNGGNEKLQ